MFEAYDKGKSCTDLAKDLKRRGIPTVRGGALWRPNSVLNILRNPIYTGAGKFAKRQWVKKTDEQGFETKQLRPTPERAIETRVPAIVTPELWERVQRKISQNQIAAMAHAKIDYLLRRVITCGICGLKYMGRGTHYSCIGRHCAKRLYGDTQKPCAAPTIRREDIETAVWSRIQGFLRRPGAVLRELERQIRIESSPLRLSDKIREAEQERTHQERKLERIQSLFIEGEISADQRRERREQVRAATAAIDQRIEALRKLVAEQYAAERGLAAAKTVLESLREVADGKPTFDQKRRAVEALVNSIEVGADGRTKIAFVFEPDHLRIANGYAPMYTGPIRSLFVLENEVIFPPRTAPAVPPAVKGTTKAKERRRA
jgi:site-specific DNA recombinase